MEHGVRLASGEPEAGPSSGGSKAARAAVAGWVVLGTMVAQASRAPLAQKAWRG